MAKYKLKDGSIIEAPKDITPEETKWLTDNGAQKQTASGWADAFKSGMSGLYEGAIRAPFILGDLSTMGMNMLDKTFDKNAPQRPMQSDQVLEIIRDKTGKELHVPETTAGRYVNSAANAVGGSVLGGLGSLRIAPSLGRVAGVGNNVKSAVSRTLQTPITANAAAGAGAELAGDYSRGFDETREQSPIARLAGGLTTGVGGAIAARSAAPRYESMIHQATKEMSPADFRAAQAMNAELKAAGATVQTIPDTLPSTSSLRGVAREISNAPGGQALNTKLAGRSEGEISTLLGDAKDQMQRSSVPNVSVLPGPGRDEFIADVARGNRTSALLPDLRNAPLFEETKLNDMVAALEKRARLPRNAGTEDGRYSSGAATAMNGLPRYPLPQPGAPGPTSGPMPITGGPGMPTPAGGPMPPMGLPAPALRLPAPTGTELSMPPTQGGPLALRPDLQDINVGSRNGFSYPPGSVTDVTPKLPQGVNLEALSKVVKSLQDVDPLPLGPAGQVLKNNAALGAAGAAGTELKKQSPAYAAAMQKYGELSPQVELTQLLAKNKLKPVSNTANSSLTTDNTREELAALMAKIDPANAPMVSAKMKTADQLSKLRPEMGAANVEGQYGSTLAAKVASPFSTLSRATNLGMRLGVNEQVANLLANPTVANYKILQRMSENDPALRKIMANMGQVGGIGAATQTQGSN